MNGAHLISVNVGMPREVSWRGQKVTTGIYKEPVAGSVNVRFLNLDGDRQADLKVHGGADKAVYVYPSEHYEYWRGRLSGVELPAGMFGENFTTAGLLEDDVCIGDRYRIGTAEFVVTQPRMPCFKLGIKFGSETMIRKFLESRRTGFYLSVSREGVVEADQPIERMSQDPQKVSVAGIVRLYLGERDPDLLRRAVQVDALPEGWRRHLLKE